MFEWLVRLLYPAKCVFCGKVIPEAEQLVCKQCFKKIPRTVGDAQTQQFPNVCSCCSPLYYADDVRESILRYKFHGAAAYSKTYADFITKCIDENQISCDIITWVPLSRKRLRRRGYDQARLIAEYLAKKMDKPLVPTLKKTRNTRRQSLIHDKTQRQKNVEGAYLCPFPENVSGKTVLIVDDVVTTGSTFSECGKILKASGAKEVYACSLARKRD